MIQSDKETALIWGKTMGTQVLVNQLSDFKHTCCNKSAVVFSHLFFLMGINLVTHLCFLNSTKTWISLTCHSENCLLNYSVLIHVVHPKESSPCLHCGQRMRKGRAPVPHFSHCHYHYRCCCSWVTPPRNLLDKSDNLLSTAELKSVMCTQM